MPTPYALSSDLVSAWPAKSLEVATYLDTALAAKRDNAPAINAQVGTTYTFVLTDATAGKTITANNASASTYTVPPQSSVAFSTGALLQVTNLGAGVVTFAGGVGVTVTNTAGTLAQYQTATLVRTGSDAWTVIPAGGGAGSTLVATATASAASAVSVNNCFTSTYDNYLVVVEFTASSASGEYYLRLRASATDATTAYYSAFGFSGFNVDSISGQGITNGTARINVGWCNSTLGGTSSLNIKAPAIARRTAFEWFSNNLQSDGNGRFGGGAHTTATAYDGFTLYPASGTVTTPTNGIRVYGLKNA